MSALGPKQTWTSALHMSAIGGKADKASGCFVISFRLETLLRNLYWSLHWLALS